MICLMMVCSHSEVVVQVHGWTGRHGQRGVATPVQGGIGNVLMIIFSLYLAGGGANVCGV